MNVKDLKRLGRLDLLEMLLEQEKENELLQMKIKEQDAKLKDRTLRMSKAGSIAEAAFMINGIFETAEATCSQYLENVRRLSEHQDEINAQRDAESQAKAQALLDETAQRCAQMEAETKQKCDELLADTNRLVDEKWASISKRLSDLYSSHEGLLELVNFGLTLVPKRGADDATNTTDEAQH